MRLFVEMVAVEITLDSRATPAPAEPPQALWTPALPPHSLENARTSDLHVISVELKQPIAKDRVEQCLSKRWSSPSAAVKPHFPDLLAFLPLPRTFSLAAAHLVLAR